MVSITTGDPFIKFSSLDAALKTQLAVKIAQWGPERKYIATEISAVNSELMAQFLNPDIRAYAVTCARFKGLIDSRRKLLYSEQKQIFETLQLMFIMYERFVWNSLLEEYFLCPDIDDLPSDADIRSFIVDLIDQHLCVCGGYEDLKANILVLKEKVLASNTGHDTTGNPSSQGLDTADPLSSELYNHKPVEDTVSLAHSYERSRASSVVPSTPLSKSRFLPQLPSTPTKPRTLTFSNETRTAPSTPGGVSGASLSRTLLFSSQILPPGAQEDVVKALGSLSNIDEQASESGGRSGCKIA
ncbi:hypothetical protein BJ138DRAFT_159093 [Hygrophoropsis aurantiaca]|uniref:Uncharacterized protein n=1 Tax=Hygrophoropsis aurantiaca TaxID=72124 RepID=A0ACB8A9W1_9AGAM|nr:hypothetical protein BJ138DRAFT_159093 [Hygrophoropsis aurantiaca]